MFNNNKGTISSSSRNVRHLITIFIPAQPTSSDDIKDDKDEEVCHDVDGNSEINTGMEINWRIH
jgi:hypothetical protein